MLICMVAQLCFEAPQHCFSIWLIYTMHIWHPDDFSSPFNKDFSAFFFSVVVCLFYFGHSFWLSLQMSHHFQMDAMANGHKCLNFLLLLCLCSIHTKLQIYIFLHEPSQKWGKRVLQLSFSPWSIICKEIH